MLNIEHVSMKIHIVCKIFVQFFMQNIKFLPYLPTPITLDMVYDNTFLTKFWDSCIGAQCNLCCSYIRPRAKRQTFTKSFSKWFSVHLSSAWVTLPTGVRPTGFPCTSAALISTQAAISRVSTPHDLLVAREIGLVSYKTNWEILCTKNNVPFLGVTFN